MLKEFYLCTQIYLSGVELDNFMESEWYAINTMILDSLTGPTSDMMWDIISFLFAAIIIIPIVFWKFKHFRHPFLILFFITISPTIISILAYFKCLNIMMDGLENVPNNSLLEATHFGKINANAALITGI